MSKHTPGPWTVEPMCNYGHDIYADEDKWIGQANNSHGTNTNVSGFVPDKVCTANAHLMAAAPDLLEALEDMLGKAYKQNWNDHYPEILEQAQAAADKARGE